MKIEDWFWFWFVLVLDLQKKGEEIEKRDEDVGDKDKPVIFINLGGRFGFVY